MRFDDFADTVPSVYEVTGQGHYPEAQGPRHNGLLVIRSDSATLPVVQPCGLSGRGRLLLERKAREGQWFVLVACPSLRLRTAPSLKRCPSPLSTEPIYVTLMNGLGVEHLLFLWRDVVLAANRFVLHDDNGVDVPLPIRVAASAPHAVPAQLQRLAGVVFSHAGAACGVVGQAHDSITLAEESAADAEAHARSEAQEIEANDGKRCHGVSSLALFGADDREKPAPARIGQLLWVALKSGSRKSHHDEQAKRLMLAVVRDATSANDVGNGAKYRLGWAAPKIAATAYGINSKWLVVVAVFVLNRGTTAVLARKPTSGRQAPVSNGARDFSHRVVFASPRAGAHERLCIAASAAKHAIAPANGHAGVARMAVEARHGAGLPAVGDVVAGDLHASSFVSVAELLPALMGRLSSMRLQSSAACDGHYRRPGSSPAVGG